MSDTKCDRCGYLWMTTRQDPSEVCGWCKQEIEEAAVPDRLERLEKLEAAVLDLKRNEPTPYSDRIRALYDLVKE